MTAQPLPATPQRQSPDTYQSTSCRTCHGPIARDELGAWSHLAVPGRSASGWLCPPPYLRLATPETVDLGARPQPTVVPSSTRERTTRSSPQQWPRLTKQDWWR